MSTPHRTPRISDVAPTSTLHALEALAEHLRIARDFESPLRAFEELVARREFLHACVGAQSALLDELGADLARRVVGPRAEWRWLGLLRHEASGLVHGAARIGAHYAIAFYFERHDLGLAAIARPHSTEVRFARFHAVRVPAAMLSTTRVRGAA